MLPERSHIVFLCIAVTLALALPLLALIFGAAPRALLLGGLAWLVAVVLKLIAAGLLRVFMESPSTPVGQIRLAAFHGALSATTELGTAGLLFPYRGRGVGSLVDVVAFGLGAWALEVLFVTMASLARRLQHVADSDRQHHRWLLGARRSIWVRGAALWERLAALANHVGARCVIVTAVPCGARIAMIIAWLGFAIVDGVAAWGHISGWDWFELSVLRRYYSLILALGGIQLLVFVALRIAC